MAADSSVSAMLSKTLSLAFVSCFIISSPIPAYAQKPPSNPPVVSSWPGIDWQAAEAIGTWIGFIGVVIGLLYAHKQIALLVEQLRLAKGTIRADLIVRLDERYCSDYFQQLRRRAEALGAKLKDLAPDEREDLINFLGFFELLGLYEHDDYITLEQVNIMFGSALIQYREAFAEFIDKGPWWLYLKSLYTKLKQARNVRPHLGIEP